MIENTRQIFSPLLSLILLSLLCGSCEDRGEAEPSSLELDHPSILRNDEPATDGEGPAAENVEEYQVAADLVRQYYTAISRGSDRRAFDLWEEGSREYDEFTAEAEQIERAVVTFGRSGRAGVSDGMPTIEVPVSVAITTRDGTTSERAETFLLRRTPTEGWRIVDRQTD